MGCIWATVSTTTILDKNLKFQTGETSITETAFFDPVLQRNHHVFYSKMSI